MSVASGMSVGDPGSGPRMTSDRDDDLSSGVAGGDVAEGVGCLVEGVGAVYDGPDFAGREQVGQREQIVALSTDDLILAALEPLRDPA